MKKLWDQVFWDLTIIGVDKEDDTAEYLRRDLVEIYGGQISLLVLCGLVEVILEKNLEEFRSREEDRTMAEELVIPDGEDEIDELLFNRGKSRQLSTSFPGPELEWDSLGG